jgi:hypothetical protein
LILLKFHLPGNGSIIWFQAKKIAIPGPGVSKSPDGSLKPETQNNTAKFAAAVLLLIGNGGYGGWS